MGRSALKLALAAEKGIDPREKKFKRELKAKRKAKENEKKQGIQDVDSDEEDEEVGIDAEMADDDDDDDEEMDGDHRLDIEALDDSDSDSGSEIEIEEKIVRPKNDPPALAHKKRTAKTQLEDDDEEDEDEDDEEEDVLLSDIEDEEDREDIVPHTKLSINNKSALTASLNRILIDTSSSVPFATHQSLLSSKPTGESIPDVSDDLQRELGLLSQSLEAARKGRTLLLKEGVPFSRPSDYFAEMVKDDGHMQKVKAKLVDEATAKKAAAEARKLRDLKKFGKQVQVAKLQERQKAKRDTLDKIKTLKKKRQEGGTSNLGTTEGDLFDVAVDKELKGYNGGGNPRSGAGRGNRTEPNTKRRQKNEKYGFGGKKRHAKSGDAMSSGDVSGFNSRRTKAGHDGRGVAKGRIGKPSGNRPGKNRRKAMASK